MSFPKVNITPEEIKKFRKHGLLDETRFAYLKIRIEFEKRCIAEPNKTKSEIINELTEEVQKKGLSLGFDAVRKICYNTIPSGKSKEIKFEEL